MNRSDTSILEHTINILLIGVDHAPERETWGGKKSFHSDVMIVLAINTDTNEVNMISLPRDTYARIPGVKGIYKLNASLDCGGGWVAGSDPSEGCFDKVCESASWMLGGIPVKYYYAVDMTAVKGLVDNIGGVDYDLDITFRIQGRSYEMGRQHMDGQAVLDYMRVRHNEDIISPKGQASDVHRVERQKKMLVAIFNKLRSTGLIYNVDSIIGAFSGNLFTNVPLDQTAAIAAYAVNVDPNNIKMNSMVGKMQYGIFNWNFTITNQKKRVDLIKHIYGNAAIDLYNIHEYSLMKLEYVKMLWEQMQIEVVTNVSRPLLDQAMEILDDDADLPDYPVPTATPSPSPSPSPSTTVSTDPETSPTPTPSPSPSPSPTPSPTPIPSEGYRQYPEDGEIWTIYNRAEAAYQQLLLWDFDDTSSKHLADTKALKEQLKADIMDLYEKLALGTDRTDSYWDRYVWHVIYGDTDKKLKESDYNQSIVHNEIPVDFN
jgi:LCP family protein required for cell wall assembly